MKKTLYYILLAISLSLALNILYINLFDPVSIERFYWTNQDEANNLAAELMIIDKGLFKNDPFFPHAMYSRRIPFCYHAFWSYVAYLGKALGGNLELANAIITFVFSIIFILGVFALSWYLSGNPYIGILVAIFSSMPIETTSTQVYGLRYLFRPAVLNNLWNYLSPWFLFLFFKTAKSFKGLLSSFLILALFTSFHVIGASLLMAVILITVIITKIGLWKKTENLRPWKIILLAAIALIAVSLTIMPHRREFFKIPEAKVPVEWFRFRFSGFFYNKSIIIDKVTFWLIPAIFGLSGYWLKKRSGERWENDSLIGVFFLSTLAVAILGSMANYNRFLIRFHIDRASIHLYPIIFLYAAYGVAKLYSKKRLVSILLSVFMASLLIVPSDKVIVPSLRRLEDIVLPSKRVPHRIEREEKRARLQRYKGLKPSFLEMAGWIKKNTDIDDIFIIPLAHQFPAFRYYAKRGIVVDWKGGSALVQSTDLSHRWVDTYTLVEDAYKSGDVKKFIHVAKRFKASYLVTYKGSFYIDLPIVYQNEDFVIYKTIP